MKAQAYTHIETQETSPVEDREYYDLFDAIVEQLEDELDELDLDLDIDVAGGNMAVTMPDGSAIVLSRQISTHEVWVAAQSGGYHLGYLDDQWYCSSTSESLSRLLGRVFSEQLDRPVSLLES